MAADFEKGPSSKLAGTHYCILRSLGGFSLFAGNRYGLTSVGFETVPTANEIGPFRIGLLRPRF